MSTNPTETELENGTVVFIEGNADGTCIGCCQNIVDALEDITGEHVPIACVQQEQFGDEWHLVLRALIGVSEEDAASLCSGYPVRDNGIHLCIDNGDVILTAIGDDLYERESTDIAREILNDEVAL